MARCQVSELEQPMDEGDGVALMDADFPEDTLPDKPANVVQVRARGEDTAMSRRDIYILMKALWAIICQFDLSQNITKRKNTI